MLEDGLKTIGKYRIIGTLGRGSMGVVYKARDPEIGRTVALKTLRKIDTSSPEKSEALLERFRIEARSAGRLRHPNIITIFDVNVQGDTPYIVMDYVQGESLADVIKKHGRIEPELAVHYLRQVASGLDAAHAAGVIHRDIKPRNIIVDGNHRVYILDFGIARINESLANDSIGGEGTVMGSPGYMSPEQILNENIDARSDLFSLGIVAFECFAGVRPFPGESFTEVVSNILNCKPLSLTSLVSDLPLSLEADFDRALARQREDRFQNATDMIESFAELLGSQTRVAKRPANSANTRDRKPSEWRSINMTENSKSLAPAIGARPNVPRRVSPGPASYSGGGSGPIAAASSAASGAAFGFPLPANGSPGSMFASSTASFSAPLNASGMSRERKLTIMLMFVCVLFGTLILWVVTSSEGIAGKQAMARLRPTAQPAQQIGPVVSEISPLTDLEYDIPPTGKLVNEMSSRELLGVLTLRDLPENVILEALREAGERSIPKLLEGCSFPLQNDSYVVRIAAVKALAELGDRRAIVLLLPLLDDYDPLVRGHTAKALGKLGGRSALGYLSARLMKEDSATVKFALQRAIDKINGFSSRK